MVNLLERTGRRLARKIGARRVVDLVSGRKPWRSELVSLGLRRDLTIPFTPSPAKIPITVRAMQPADIPVIFDETDLAADDDERALRKSRRELAEQGKGTAYVAVTENGMPCYAQWLITPTANERLRPFFHGVFPILAADEALLEAAYTPVQYRGLGIMPCAMAQIAERGLNSGARWVITFVTESNLPSIKGCVGAGFAPYVRRIERWHGPRRTLTFTPLTD